MLLKEKTMKIFNERPQKDSKIANYRSLKEHSKQLKPFQTPIRSPQHGDWLFEIDEQSQSFTNYYYWAVRQGKLRKKSLFIDVLPIGTFTKQQLEILNITAKYLSLTYNTATRLYPITAMADYPAAKNTEQRQILNQNKTLQIKSSYFFHNILRPDLAKDALAFIIITTIDLYPRDSWAFCFGTGFRKYRVGVYSLARLGSPDVNESSYQLALLRTLKVASHEVGHLLGMRHCTFYICNMCGSNSLSEVDQYPLSPCAECLVKICYFTTTNPLRRSKLMYKFAKDHNIETVNDLSRLYYPAIKGSASQSQSNGMDNYMQQAQKNGRQDEKKR